jgi:Fur family peroxide stress response transcriptional regulator
MELHRRKSKQRERIYELVRTCKDHPTAQSLYDRLKLEMPNLSLGNVYRNLAILLEEGRLQGNEFGSGTQRYDADTAAHCHFVCARCHTVSDFAMAAQADIVDTARRLTSHRIMGHTIRFYGVCADCLAAEESKSKTRR